MAQELYIKHEGGETAAGGNLEHIMARPTIPGPFSLGLAEKIMSRKSCIYCSHELGDYDEVLETPMCSHQVLAQEVIRWHRKKVEEEAGKPLDEVFGNMVVE